MTFTLAVSACESESTVGMNMLAGGLVPAPPAGGAPMMPAAPQSRVVMEAFGPTGQLLFTPRDLAFNPRVPGQLWVVSADGSVVIAAEATEPAGMKMERRRDRRYDHFMPNPSALAFGADPTNDAAVNAALVPGTFATCQESRNGGLNPRVIGNNFMGPVLWSSDLSVFALRNGELGSHLDMLHQSPLCMGIAWEGTGNAYWAFNALAGSLDRYDFKADHGVGNDNHEDGTVHRFIPGQLGYVEAVPSHLVYRVEEHAVYIADTAAGRVLKLHDLGSANVAGSIIPKQDEAFNAIMTGATLVEIVPTSAGIVQRPSGLEIANGQLFVSDNATGDIVRLTLAGQVVARYQTNLGAGALAGMAFGPDGRLYFVDMKGNRVLRFEARL